MNTKVAKKLTTKSALRTGLEMQYVSWFCISQRCTTAQRLFVNKALLLSVQQFHDEIFLSNGTACRQGGKELVLFLLHVFVSTSSLCIIFLTDSCPCLSGLGIAVKMCMLLVSSTTVIFELLLTSWKSFYPKLQVLLVCV